MQEPSVPEVDTQQRAPARTDPPAPTESQAVTLVSGAVGGLVGALLGAVMWWLIRELVGSEFSLPWAFLAAVLLGGLTGTWVWLFAGQRSVWSTAVAAVDALIGATFLLDLVSGRPPLLFIVARSPAFARSFLRPGVALAMGLTTVVAVLVAVIVALPMWGRIRSSG